MIDLYFHGIWRMDWGLGNPNKTGALIALLMISVWGLSFISPFRKWGFWVALTLFTGLGVCLIHTFSRGGLIALFAGLVPLILTAPRPWSRSRVMALVVMSWILIGASAFLNAEQRFGQGIVQEDRSITNRFEIWKSAPRMMLDAPEGWGIGHSGDAYMQWYQPLSEHQGYSTLVNSHLTWLVEIGWPLRFAYLFGWGCVFLLCWPEEKRRWFVVPLGVWITFAVAAAFSSVAESLWLWVVPIATLLAVLAVRIRDAEWPSMGALLIPFGSAVALCGFFYLVGSQTPSQIHRQGETLLFGGTAPQVWLIPDPQILGKNLGYKIRVAAEKQIAPLAMGILLDSNQLHSLQGQTVILAGNPATHDQLEKIFREASAVELINPGFFPQEVGLGKAEIQQKEIKLVVGEFSESPACAAWKGLLPPTILPGVGDYLPQWSTAVLGLTPVTAH
jgi:hypothetical protein